MSNFNDLKKQMEADNKEIQVIEKERQKKIDDILVFSEYNEEDKIISSFEALDIINKLNENTGKYITGFYTLDKMLGGLEDGEMITISGWTGNGKTTLCQSITKNLSDNNVNSLWFTYEVGLKNFISKFGKTTPLFFLPKRIKSNTLNWIHARIKEAKIKYEVKIVFIDHLHYLVNLGQAVNISFLLGEIMRNLRKIAIKENIVIILIAHTQKIRNEESPSLADIRDSSLICQESDDVMIIKRCGMINKTTKEITYFETANLYLLKNRRAGILGKTELIMKDGLFYELDNKMQ